MLSSDCWEHGPAKKNGGTQSLGFRPSPVRGEVELLGAVRLFHAGAHAIASFKAHDAFVQAECQDAVLQWNCALQREASVFHPMPFTSVHAAEELGRAIDNREQMMAMLVVLERSDLCLGQVGGHWLPGSALLLAEEAL